MTDLGEEAIELVVKWYRYDLLLLDICLPDMSGYEVLRTWRASGVTTPVLVVTGSGDMEAKAYEYGADGFYAQPFYRDTLVPGMFAAVRKASDNPALVTIGKLRVDTEAKRAVMGKALLFLTDDEYRALELMAFRRGSSVDIRELNAYLFAGLKRGRAGANGLKRRCAPSCSSCGWPLAAVNISGQPGRGFYCWRMTWAASGSTGI